MKVDLQAVFLYVKVVLWPLTVCKIPHSEQSYDSNNFVLAQKIKTKMYKKIVKIIEKNSCPPPISENGSPLTGVILAILPHLKRPLRTTPSEHN